MTSDKKAEDKMFSTQPSETLTTDEPPTLENFEGASFRLSLTPERAEARHRSKDDSASLPCGDEPEEKSEEKQETDDQARPRITVDHQKELLKLFNGFPSRHHRWQLFSDFCEMAAIT